MAYELARRQAEVVVRAPGRELPLRHVIGIGRNYAEHAREQGAAVPEYPVVFSKNPAALCLDGEEIVVPPVCQEPPQTDFEAELAVVIGVRARDVPRERAGEVILGYACANDVSARWWQKQGSGGQFYRGKSFDTFCPLGPRVVGAGFDPADARIRCRVNGVVMQDARTSQVIFDVPTLVAELSRGTTLLPGTVILTGTPAGVGMSRNPPVFLAAGDVVEVEIDGLGVLRNRVRFQ